MAITDLESAKKWLELQQDPKVNCALAARAAQRALPSATLLGRSSNPDQLFLVMHWAVLICGVASFSQDPKILYAAAGANKLAQHYADLTDLHHGIVAYQAVRASVQLVADNSYDQAARVVGYSAGAVQRMEESEDGFHASISASGLDRERYEASRAATQMFHFPLWEGDKLGGVTSQEPELTASGWNHLCRFFSADSCTWGFWHRWLEGMRNGQPMDWDLQREVALIGAEDDFKIWEDGPEAVAEKIREIEEDYWSKVLPQHEVLERDETDGKFTVKAEAFDSEQSVEGWLKQIDFAVSLAVESNTSDFNRMCTAFKYIDHTLENCRDDPNAIEQQIGVARGIIETNLNDATYAADDSLRALASVLEQVQIQMRADHPDVRKAWEKRIAQKLREVDRETKVMAAEAIRAETQRTKGRAEAEMLLDAETVETSESAESQAIALRRAGGRAAKMNAIERASKTVHTVDKSAGYKSIRIVGTGYNVGDIIWMLKDLLGF